MEFLSVIVNYMQFIKFYIICDHLQLLCLSLSLNNQVVSLNYRTILLYCFTMKLQAHLSLNTLELIRSLNSLSNLMGVLSIYKLDVYKKLLHMNDCIDSSQLRSYGSHYLDLVPMFQ